VLSPSRTLTSLSAAVLCAAVLVPATVPAAAAAAATPAAAAAAAAPAAAAAAAGAPAAAADGPDAPPPTRLASARSALPPGESGFYSVAGEAAGKASGDPAAYGTHTDDQRDLYWSFRLKDAPFSADGPAQTPKAGVRIHRDAAGVPSVFGDTGRDVWFGAGYAAATDRLFELDGVRRTAEGRLAELTGQGGVPADLAQRVTGYSTAEYAAILAGLSPEGRDAIEGYAAGVQQRIAEVRADPRLLPAEYVLLQAIPEDWSVTDTLASGVYITRFVATQGGLEMDNVKALRELESTYGTAEGRRVFQDLFGDEDPKATVTITGRDFSNVPAADRSPAAREAAFQRMADYADTLPLELATGPGTGNSPAPLPLAGLTGAAAQPGLPAPVAASLLRAAAGLQAWAASLHGGSYGFAVAPSRTRDGQAMLQSSPQLDYSYPGLLYELQVHGGGYDARGVSVPGIPTVGIGWTGSTAWALTTGYSKTIDSFIETTRANPVAGGPPQYLHGGVWTDESCRTETVRYRASVMGVPTGPAALSQSSQVCRTVHGPVVAATADGARARSVTYAQFLHDVDTVDGILAWDRAKTLGDIEAGVRRVAWNENIVAADADGHIGYWHPGRYLRRAAGTDQRFPTPGDGSMDPQGLLSFDELPHVVDPPEGYVANWNTKPAHGWVDGDLTGSTTRPAGPGNRLTQVTGRLAARHDLTPDALLPQDEAIGSSDMRAPSYLPLLLSIRSDPTLSARDRAALDLLAGWDGRAYAPGAPGGSSPLGTPAGSVTDGPAATLFAALAAQVRGQLFAGVPADLLARLSALPKQAHQYDVVPLDNLALRVLRPGFSGVPAARDWSGGRSPAEVVRTALEQALDGLTATYGADPASWRRPHAVSKLRSLTGVIGPTADMPFEDRGSWVHQVAFQPVATTTAPVGTTTAPAHQPAVARRPAKHARPAHRARPPARQPKRALAFTGSGPLLAEAALLLLGAALLARRRRPGRPAD